MNEAGNLPKTILYSLNPNDDEALGTILGCFQNSDAIGKIQQGSAWWFNDNKTGMMKQMISLANLGLLGHFNGMLTDSRSFLSYPRHEYFRRILCELIGGWVENGEYPKDMKSLEKIIKGISYNNAVRYFGFNLETKYNSSDRGQTPVRFHCPSLSKIALFDMFHRHIHSGPKTKSFCTLIQQHVHSVEC